MNIQVTVPLPIQVVIDDVGWWSGENGSSRGEPYRTGIARNHVPADYQAIASLGQQLNMRPQAAMILCEWDTDNLLRRVPSCNWMGKQWDNSRWIGPWLEEAATLLREHRDFLELTLHGIGHEFWDEDDQGRWSFTRAEWHGPGGIMRPRHEILARLDLFQELLTQHNLGDFPRSFVPCAFVHAFGEAEENLAGLLKERGIDFISTPFQSMKHVQNTGHPVFGFDRGVLTVDRGKDVMPWYAIGQIPTGELSGPICGMHWPNLLHPDPSRNEEIVSGWVQWLQRHGNRYDRILAPDTAFFASQLLHHYTTQCRVSQTDITLDFSQHFQLPQHPVVDGILVKVQSSQPLHFSSSQAHLSKVHTYHQADKFISSVLLNNPQKLNSIRIEYHPSFL